MDERILVEVYVPTVRLRFYVAIPVRYTIKEIKEQLLDLIEEASDSAFIKQDQNVLYLTRCHCALKGDRMVCDIPLLHSDKLIIW